VSLAFLFIQACSSSQSPDPPPPKTVFDPLTQQLDRARDVQNTVNQNAEATRNSVDSQERGDSSR
jgi:hypothetical protein